MLFNVCSSEPQVRSIANNVRPDRQSKHYHLKYKFHALTHVLEFLRPQLSLYLNSVAHHAEVKSTLFAALDWHSFPPPVPDITN